MIKTMIERIDSLLPLTIKEIAWNDPILLIIGNNWNFSTVSSWRIIGNNKLICGCYDNDSYEEIQKLIHYKIISIDIQSRYLQVDPIFEFRKDEQETFKLEIFSTTFLEPWTFSLDKEIVYVASPSEP